MEKNVGGSDQISRWVIGGALLAYALTTKGWRRWLALSLGSSLASTASLQKCLVNKALDVNTATPLEESPQERKKKVEAKIDEASEESFPASDPPAYTAGVA